MNITPLTTSAIFVLGLMVGSFLNVCIWRLPAGEQVIRGRSRCMTCAKTITWYDNIPLVSYLVLRGRCRNCRSVISPMYPLVEFLTAALLAGVVARFGLTPVGAVYALLAAALVLLSMIDVKEMILPDEVTVSGLPVAFVLCYFVPALHGTSSGWEALWAGFLGALVGAGILWGVGAVGSLIFRRQAMGMGDVKLMGLVGSLIGWQKVLLVSLILAPLLGSVVGLLIKARYKVNLIPYGPFLSMGTLIALFWGEELIEWYLGVWIGG